MSRTLFIGGVLLVAAGYYGVALPFLAAERLKTAVEERDAETFVSLIDFESLRADLKSDLMASMAAEMEAVGREPFLVELGGAVTGELVDRTIQPEILGAMLTDGAEAKGQRIALPQDADISTRLGFLRLVVTIEQNGDPLDIIFEPRGLGYKVVGLDMDLTGIQ